MPGDRPHARHRALQCDTHVNRHGTECIVREWFRDSEVLIRHVENLAHLMDAIVATGSESGEVLDEPSEELDGAPVA